MFEAPTNYMVILQYNYTDDDNAWLFERRIGVLVTSEVNGAPNDLFDAELSDVFHRIGGHLVVVNNLPVRQTPRAQVVNG